MSRTILSGWDSVDTYAAHRGCSPRTVRNYISKGFFPAYKVPGRRGVLIDREEADRAMARVPASKAYGGVAAYGPNAIIKPLPVRAEVVQRDGEQR